MLVFGDKLQEIEWGIKNLKGRTLVKNTCAMDSFLFAFSYLTMTRKLVRKNIPFKHMHGDCLMEQIIHLVTSPDKIERNRGRLIAYCAMDIGDVCNFDSNMSLYKELYKDADFFE